MDDFMKKDNTYSPNKYILNFLNYLKYERKLSDNTISSYQNDLKRFDIYFNSNILNLESKDIEAYLSSLNDLNSRSIAHHLTVLNSLYNFLLSENNIVSKNPCINVVGPKRQKKLPNYLSEEEIDKLLKINSVSQ